MLFFPVNIEFLYALPLDKTGSLNHEAAEDDLAERKAMQDSLKLQNDAKKFNLWNLDLQSMMRPPLVCLSNNSTRKTIGMN